MHTFQGKRVSFTWSIILPEIAKTIRFILNSGQRTFAEQAELVRQKGVWSPSNPHGAARPSHTAPHIKTGHENHALDIDSAFNGENNVQRWLNARGVPFVNNVPGESWHGDPINEAALKALANKIIAARYTTLGSRGLKQLRVKKKLVQLGFLKRFFVGPFGKPAVAALKQFQRSRNLVADGVAGPKTLAALDAAIKRKKGKA